MFVAIVDREVIGRQVVPNVARVVARDRARKASQAKAKMMMVKEKAKVASGKHAKHLMGTAVSAAPKSLGGDYPMQLEEPSSYKTATGSLVQVEGFRVLPIVTEEGLHRCMNFRVAPVHKALVSASKVCRKGYRIILDSKPGQSGMLHKHTN